jgi:hypothetical protein
VFVYKGEVDIPPDASKKKKEALKAIYRRSEEKARLQFVPKMQRKLIRMTFSKDSGAIRHTQIEKLKRRIAILA